MKRVTLFLLLSLFLTVNASAQAGPHHGRGDWQPPSAADRVKTMTEELKLDEGQSAKLLEIFTATDAQRDALRKRHEEQVRQDMCAMHKNVTGQIKSILTEQQSTEFDELMARKLANREEHAGRHGKDHRPPMDCDDQDA